MLSAASDLKLELRPEPWNLAIVALCLSPIVGACILALGEGQIVLLPALGIVASLGLWLSVATIRVRLGDGRLERHVFWRRSWAVPVGEISVRDGLGGDLPFIPAVIIERPGAAKPVGTILKSQFRPRDLEALKAALHEMGVPVSSQQKRKPK